MSRRALVVDDNRALAEDLGEILRDEGYDVAVYDDPVRALSEEGERDFDLALLDIRMPKLDGVALHQRLMAGHPRARFVLMTAYTEDDRIAQALGAGVRKVLTKPVVLSELLQAVAADDGHMPRELLLVEDDDAFGEALAEALRENGYGVERVRTVEEARREERARPVQATIVDVHLPDGDGSELAIELCKEGRGPVVLITGYDADEGQRVTAQLGARARFLEKPFAPELLLKALVELRGAEP